MAITPLITGPDGVQRTDTYFTTSRENRFFTGTIDNGTVDMQVSIRGQGFTSDPDLIAFEGTEFIVPNPSSFGEGLDLLPGSNEILVRAIAADGTVSSAARINAILVQESDLGFVVNPPTNIQIERKDGVVEIQVEGVDSDALRGIHFYASTLPGGSSRGYRPINARLVSNYDSVDEEVALASLPVQVTIAADGDGNHIADPLFFRLTGAQEDQIGNVLQSDFDQTLEIPETVERIRTSITINQLREVRTYRFQHSRAGNAQSDPPTVPNAVFTAVPDTDPLYYVATAVYYDPIRKLEVESSFSPEVQGSPLKISTVRGSIPVPSRDQIRTSLAISVNRKQPDVRIDPGSALADTFIDPGSTELFRVRFLQSFMSASNSFADLLLIDDPTAAGTPIPVPQSTYKLNLKQSLFLTDDQSVQDLIDQQFENLAGQYGVERKTGTRARGEVIFFTSRRPTASVSIPLGSIVSGGGQQFRTTEAASITIENIASFFDGSTGRYSVRVPVEARQAGSAGNVGPTQIRTIVSGPSNVQVTNTSRFGGGTDRQSNRALAAEAQRKLAGTDTGTRAGIQNIAQKVPGVVEAYVATPGDEYMLRDFDGVQHRGGKVDVWVRGTQVNTVTDSFAFAFRIAQDVQFEIIDNPSDYRFRAVSDEISEDSPILEMLDFPAYNYGLRNFSTSEDFDLTGVTVERYNVIKLSTSVPQPPVSLTDVVQGDVRFRESKEFVLRRQPASLINSVTGTVTGVVPLDSYELRKTANPLLLGRSSSAGDSLQVLDDGSASIPSGDPILVSNESHVMIGQTLEYVNFLGANPLTIVVTSVDGLTTYTGPFDPSGSPDYSIVDGTETSPLAIVRTDTSAITTGQEVLITYYHDENFTVSYQTNYLVTSAQADLDNLSHVTADILAKSTIQLPVNIEATVLLRRRVSPATTDQIIRTNLTNYIRALGLGRPLRPSDVVNVIENTTGVSYVELSTLRLYLAPNAEILRELLAPTQSADFTRITSWSTEQVSVFLLNSRLNHETTTGGGDTRLYRGVTQNDVETNLLTTLPSTLGSDAGQSFITGKEGIEIPGLSDDTTLNPNSLLTSAQVSTLRASLTGSRVLVSLPVGETPALRQYRATYFVGDDTGVKNIEPNNLTSMTLSTNNVNFTYDEDRV